MKIIIEALLLIGGAAIGLLLWLVI